MKKCPSCTKELPDSALVCVFCRTKLASPPGTPGGGPSPAKTMMGYAAVTGDLLKGVGAAPPPAAPAPPPPAEPAPSMASTMMVPPGGLPAGHPGHQPPPAATPRPDLGHAATMMVEPGALPPGHPLAAAQSAGLPRAPSAQPAPQASGGMPRAPSAQPAAYPPASGGMPPMHGYPPPQQGYAPPQQQQPYPPASGGMPPMGQPQGYPPQQPYPPASGGMAPMGQPPYPHGQPPGLQPTAPPPEPLAVAPSAMAAAPWQSAQGMGPAPAPVSDPFLPPLKRTLIIFGSLLLLTCLVPWSVMGRTTFSWNALTDLPQIKMQLPIIALYLATVLCWVFAFVPAGSGVRGLFAFLGGGMMMATSAALIPFDELHGQGWRLLLLILAWYLGPTALVLRGRYRESMAARFMATAAVLMHLAIFIVPVEGEIPLLGLFKSITSGEDKLMVMGIVGLVIFLVGLLPLTAWLGVRVRGFGAWMMLLTPGLAMIVAFTMGAARGEPEIMFKNPAMIFSGIWLISAYALASYGLAAMLGKLHNPLNATA